MRTVATLAVVAFLALAATCSGSLLSRRPVPKHPKASASAPKDSDKGRGYALVNEFVAALHYKNYTKAASLLADDGFFFVTDVGCDVMNKSMLLAAAMNEHTAAAQLILGEWVESDGATYIKAQAGAIFDANSPFANSTYYNPNVYIAAMPTPDGKQLWVFERITDMSWRQQNNASSMMSVWNTLVAANDLGDIKPWNALLTDDFEFRHDFAWDEFPQIRSNRSEFLGNLTAQYAMQASAQSKVPTAFPACEIVIGDIWMFMQATNGAAAVQKFFITLHITPDNKASDLQEIGISYV